MWPYFYNFAASNLQHFLPQELALTRKIFHNLSRYFDSNPTFLNFLLSFRGLGFSKSRFLISKYGLPTGARFSHFHRSYIPEFEDLIQIFFAVGYVTDQLVKHNISSKIRCGAFSGKRLRLGLPSRGQRTRCNAKTAYIFYLRGAYSKL